jgi:hypothetical protein
MTDAAQTRREALILAAGATAALGMATSASAQPVAGEDPALAAHRRDWQWLVGSWTIRHHRLKERLANCTEWEDFNGAATTWLTLNGFGTIDDNIVEIPSGTYRAVSIRAFDPATRQWSIWWLDGRHPTSIDTPVRGGFANGAGEFMGDDVFNGRPIKVRFRWTEITATSARWEQAFSPDAGASWEVNWVMHFTRAT